VLGYPLSGQFGAQVAADPNHWVRRLPGGLFQNTISHPPYRITDFLSDHNPHIRADWISRNGFDFPTDLRVEFLGTEVTGSLVFDTRIQSQRVTRVYGTRGCLVVDFDAQIIHRNQSPRLPGAFGKLERPCSELCQATRTLAGNLSRFLRSDMHYFAGMRNLFERFYECISTGGEPPIPSTEIRRVTRLMDTIFEQCRASEETTDTSVNTPSDDVRHAPEIMTV
jgi:predicted dehydrogenase